MPNDSIGLPFIMGVKRSEIMSTNKPSESVSDRLKALLLRGCLNSVDITEYKSTSKKLRQFELELTVKADSSVTCLTKIEYDLGNLIDLMLAKSSSTATAGNQTVFNLNFKWNNDENYLKVNKLNSMLLQRKRYFVFLNISPNPCSRFKRT